MPIEVSDEQAQAYGRYRGTPTRDELDRSRRPAAPDLPSMDEILNETAADLTAVFWG